MRETIMGIIADLEAADGPDRSIDVMIAHAIDLKMPDDPANWPPRYSESIDAAMTLVTPEWRVYAIQEEYIVPRGNWFAGLDHRTAHYKHGSMIGKSLTPAIALCIAALKAQLSTRTNEQDDARNLSGVSSE